MFIEFTTIKFTEDGTKIMINKNHIICFYNDPDNKECSKIKTIKDDWIVTESIADIKKILGLKEEGASYF